MVMQCFDTSLLDYITFILFLIHFVIFTFGIFLGALLIPGEKKVEDIIFTAFSWPIIIYSGTLTFLESGGKRIKRKKIIER